MAWPFPLYPFDDGTDMICQVCGRDLVAVRIEELPYHKIIHRDDGTPLCPFPLNWNQDYSFIGESLYEPPR